MNKEATKQQIALAKQYKIPVSQAHTINMKKVRAYKKYAKSAAGKDEMWLENNFINRGI